jgi:DNA topoisomerase-3
MLVLNVEAQVASSALGMGPHHAMQIAERLYIQGYIRY